MTKKKQPPALEEQVKYFIQEHNLVSKDERLLVAVSGGPDSVCLLHLLIGLVEELGIGLLHLAHLDHQLRGEESAADAGYAARLAERLGVPATIDKRDVRAYQGEHRISLEEAAREVRYRFLAETAAAVGASRIAVGHTRDDHIETILMHLVRGSGTRGLKGLQPITLWPLPEEKGINIIRPLLSVSRRDTASYCERHQLKPRLDSSNVSLSPLRNRLRRQLIPLLRSYNPQVSEALLRAARIATWDMAFIDEETARQWGEIVRRQGNSIVLDKNSLQKLHPALKRNLLRTAIEELLGSPKDIEACHIEDMMAALDKPAGRQLSLPGGLVFAVEYDRYLLGAEPGELCPFPVLEDEFALKIPGKTRLPGWQVRVDIIGREEMSREDKNFTAYLDLARAGDKLVVRTRHRGDRFQPLGLGKQKKVGQFMIDEKIPRNWRQRIPLVCSLEHIVWLVGRRIDERVKVTEDTKKILCLEFKRV